MSNDVSGPDGSALSEGFGFTVGQEVTVTRRIWDPATGDSPGGLLARPGEKLIVRKIHPRSSGPHPLDISHEYRTDGLTFCVSPDEIRAYATPTNCLDDADLSHL